MSFFLPFFKETQLKFFQNPDVTLDSKDFDFLLKFFFFQMIKTFLIQ